MVPPEASAGAEKTEGFRRRSAPVARASAPQNRQSSSRPRSPRALGLAFVVVTPSRYTSVARVLLENQESYLTRPDKATNEVDQTLDDEAVQSAAETVSTPDLARKAIDALGVRDRAEFHPSGLEYLVSMLTGTSRPSAGDPVVDSFLESHDCLPGLAFANCAD